MSKIISILPRREGYSKAHFGAVSLCVHDFTLHSRYRQQLLTLGGVACEPFTGTAYEAVTYRRKFWQSRTQAYAYAITKRLHQIAPALVEIHNRPNLVLMIAAQWQGNIALHLRNDPQSMKDCKSVQQRQVLLDKCAAIYCVSDYIRKRFMDGLPPSHKVHIVYNGLNVDAIADQQKEQKITFIGRLQPEKGVLELAQALAKILPDYPDWQAVFIGAARHSPNSKPTPYEAKVRTALLPIHTQVDYKGFCDYETTMQALSTSAIAAIPSQWNEAFGRIALEAMANGCATISSLRGGLKEVVTGATYPLHTVSAESIADALEALILDEKKRHEIGALGREKAQQFSITKVTESLDVIRDQLTRML